MLRINRTLIVFVMVALIVGAWPPDPAAQASVADAAAAGPPQTPLAELLDAEGRLALASDFRGSIDARGWQMVSEPNEAPIFAPLAAEEGGQWSGNFQPRGMTDDVLAFAMDGAGNLYAGGYFDIAGGAVASNVAKWNGSTWSALGSGTDGSVHALTFDDAGNLYAGGDFTSAGGVTASNIAKWNGSAWSALGGGISGTVKALVVDGAGNLYAGGRFTTAGSVAANHVAKWNGSTWSALGSGPEPGGYDSVYAMAVDDAGNLYAGGNLYGGDIERIYKWDGSAWSTLASGIDGNAVFALAMDYFGNLYAGGDLEYIHKWNGSAWSKLDTGPGPGENYEVVYALAVDAAGNLYAGGDFDYAGGVAAKNIAQWDGVSWSALGSGMGPDGYDSDVNALAVDSAGNVFAGGQFHTAGGTVASHIARWSGSAWSVPGSSTAGGMNGSVDALALDSTGNLYAGGMFETAGGVVANCIAKWNGNSWSPLASGMASPPGGSRTTRVHALAVDDAGNLYAGGVFQTAGGVVVNHIAKWNGSTWSALGSGIKDQYDGYSTVYALTFDGAGNLYAGGDFTDAGGMTASNIAKWNGSAWSALGSGTSGGISALAVDGAGNLYAGGGFTRAGSVTASNIAKWNGSAWSALGSGTTGGISALAVDSAGTVYAGGLFSTAGSVAANNIARWNGSVWSALCSGTDGSVHALTFDGGGNLYAGGEFDNVGGESASQIAKWDGSAWSPLATGMNGGVSSLAVDGAGNLYAGGNFTTAAGKPSAYIARWEPDYELTLAKTGNGSGDVTSDPAGIDCGGTCSANFTHGTVVTLTATPAAFSTFTGWSGDCLGTGACQMTMDAARAVTATFTLQTFPLTVSKAGIGSGTVASSPAGITCGTTCSATFAAGTVVTLTATPAPGASFAGWSGACSDSSSCAIAVDAAKAVTATFDVPGAVTPQASTMYYGQQLAVEGEAAAAAPAAVTKLAVFTGTTPAGIFLVGVEGSAPYAGEATTGRLINRLLAEGCGGSACSAVHCTFYAPDGAHTDVVVTSPVITDRVYLPLVSR